MDLVHSILSGSTLQNEIASRYGFPSSISCQLLLQGVNDTYLIAVGDLKYIFRLYRYQRKSFDTICEEVALVNFLQHKSHLVAKLQANLSGEIIQSFAMPEGERYGILMECAANTEFETHCLVAGGSYSYGKSIAELHRHLTDFTPQKQSTLLDLDHLASQPIKLASKQFPDDDLSYLRYEEGRIRDWLIRNENMLSKSYIHGDLTGGNACVSQNQEFIFFDFDCCGYGWKAYDLATFYWSARMCNKPKEWNDFLDGYCSLESLNSVDVSAIPVLAMLRQIWIIGYSIRQIPVKGALFYKPKSLREDIDCLREMSKNASCLID